MDTKRLCENLERRGFTPHVFPDRSAAADYLVETLRDTTIGIGGSVTVEQLDVFDRLSAGNAVFWHWRQSEPDTRKKAAEAAVYLTSANGVSETGELVNIDGSGNRVAATLYGPKKVYFIVGRNKVEPELERAIWRARNVAAPRNARRLGCPTPCAQGEELRCYDCRSPKRICRGLVVLMEKPTSVEECHVLIVEEELGY